MAGGDSTPDGPVDGGTGQAAIFAQGLAKHYGDVKAVRGIDLAIAPGEAFGFLGPNGAGKSTTINMLCTLVRPTAGSATVAGCDVASDPGGVRARIGLVFQDYSLDAQLTARENLAFHAFLYGLRGADRTTRINEALEMVGLADRASSLVSTFSGGMKRRLEIARGILHYPQVLFLDEPTLGLDPQTRATIWEYLGELRRRENMTIFMTTHYMEEAEFCDRIAIIDDGTIVAEGSPDELKAQVGGDIVTIATADNERATSEIGAAFGIEARQSGDRLFVEVEDGAAFLPRLLRTIEVPVSEATLARPSLDTVFLKLTGKQIREESANPADRNRMVMRMHGGGRRR